MLAMGFIPIVLGLAGAVVFAVFWTVGKSVASKVTPYQALRLIAETCPVIG
jgi:drug/metabolite transporter (DMT)-like permease